MKEFYEKYPSLKEDGQFIMSNNNIIKYISTTGGYFATRVEIEKYLLDKKVIQEIYDEAHRLWDSKDMSIEDILRFTLHELHKRGELL